MSTVARPVSVPGQQTCDGIPFPLVLHCETDDADLASIEEWIRQAREELTGQAARHGAILFRGFPVRAAEDFDRFIAAFGYPNFKYEDSLSNAVRVVKTERVFTANEAPPEVTIYLHHEMAQTPVYPSKLFFFCEQAAETGGATPLCRSDLLYRRMQEAVPEFANACEEKGLQYTNVMPAADDPNSGMGRSWQSTLRAATREQAEARLRELGYTWEWLADGCLRATTPVLPAVRDLGDGRKSFFNQLIAAYQGWRDERNDPSKSIRHGDGTPLDRKAVLQCAQLAEAVTFDLPWQAGDVALVDNYVTMHGRRNFTGVRKVMASLVAAAG
jgi:alpha-ketoglutarate-dependent taurine dioxygenase